MKNIFYKKREGVLRFLFLNENLEGEYPILTPEQVDEVIGSDGNSKDSLDRLDKTESDFEGKIKEIGDLLDSYHEFKKEYKFNNREDIPKEFFKISDNAQKAKNLGIEELSVEGLLSYCFMLQEGLTKIKRQIESY